MALDPAGSIAALRLHEKLVLLTLSERYGLFTRLGLDSSVGAALLAELHFTGRIRITGKRFALVSQEPLGSPIPDRAIERIFERVKPNRTPRLNRWITKLIKISPYGSVISQLLEQDFIRLHREYALGFWIREKYVFEDSGVEEKLLRFLRRPLLYGSGADSQTAALLGLAQAAGLLEALVPIRDLGRSRQNMRALVKQAGEVIAAARQAIYLYRLGPVISAVLSVAGVLFGILRD